MQLNIKPWAMLFHYMWHARQRGSAPAIESLITATRVDPHAHRRWDDEPDIRMNDFSRGPRVFYGWYILAASFVILFLNTGGRSIIGLMVKPMAEEFGWSRGAISSAVFLNMAVFSVATIVTGRLYDRHGPKWVIAGSTLLFSAGYALMATMDSLWQFLAYYGVLSAAGLGGITTSIFGSIIGNWFERRRGLAVSLALAGSCLGQFFLIPVFSDMILVSGWRSPILWIAVLSLAVNLPLVFGVIRGNPDRLGLEPYGARDRHDRREPQGRVNSLAGPSRAAVAPVGLTLSEAMRTRSLWLFTFVMFVCGGADYLVTTHLVAMVTDYGISDEAGANMLAWLGLLSLGGILIAGPAADAIGNKIPIAATFAFRILLFAMLFSFKGEVPFWIFALGFGLTLAVTAPLSPDAAWRPIRRDPPRLHLRVYRDRPHAGRRVMGLPRRSRVRQHRQLRPRPPDLGRDGRARPGRYGLHPGETPPPARYSRQLMPGHREPRLAFHRFH